jgi:hypothetical protein
LPDVNIPERAPSVPTQPGIDLSGSDRPPTDLGVDLSDPESFSSIDEAVDLYAEAANPPSISDSGSLEISPEAYAESQRKAEQQESSSVDLNTPPNFPSNFDLEPGAAAASPASRVSESDIDLNLPPVQDETGSSLIHRGGSEDDDKDLAAELEARRRPADRKAKESPERARAKARQVAPARRDESGGRKNGPLFIGGAVGLLIGAGAVLAAFFGGLLPERKSQTSAPAADNSAVVAQLKQEAETAKKEAADARARADTARRAISDAGMNPDRAADDIKALVDARAASDAKVRQLNEAAAQNRKALTAAQDSERDARAAEQTAKSSLAAAQKSLTDTRNQLAAATKSADAAKADVIAATKMAEAAKSDAAAARKSLDDAVGNIAKALKAAGVENAKPEEGIKKLADARAAADTKEKETATKLADSVKKEVDLARAVDVAKKAADDATKARDASETTLKTIGEKLAKAKFTADKPDANAVIKGLDDALKVATTDATATLRDELAKARAQETKLTKDLTAAKERETTATKLADAAKIEAQRAQDVAKVAEQKLAAEIVKSKTEAERLRKDAADAQTKAADATAKAAAAEKAAVQEKAAAEQLAVETRKLKAENEQLARDIQTVRELAELIKSQPSAIGLSGKVDPSKLADRFFADGVRAFHAGRYSDAEAAFRRAIQFRSDDARYHYLLGLSLWMSDEKSAAEVAFEKGRDLELSARPPSRAISIVLERIQGPARQAMNAYRP